MNDDTVETTGTGNAQAALDLAADAMFDLLKVWGEFVKRSKQNELPGNSEFTTASTEMVKLRRHLLDGIKQHEQDVRNKENRTDTAAIDFDARRDEIGRRLARLRAVRDDD